MAGDIGGAAALLSELVGETGNADEQLCPDQFFEFAVLHAEVETGYFAKEHDSKTQAAADDPEASKELNEQQKRLMEVNRQIALHRKRLKDERDHGTDELPYVATLTEKQKQRIASNKTEALKKAAGKRAADEASAVEPNNTILKEKEQLENQQPNMEIEQPEIEDSSFEDAMNRRDVASIETKFAEQEGRAKSREHLVEEGHGALQTDMVRHEAPIAKRLKPEQQISEGYSNDMAPASAEEPERPKTDKEKLSESVLFCGREVIA